MEKYVEKVSVFPNYLEWASLSGPDALTLAVMCVPSHWGGLIFEVSSRSSPLLKKSWWICRHSSFLSCFIAVSRSGNTHSIFIFFVRILDHGMYILRDFFVFPDWMRKTANQIEMGLHKLGHKIPQAQLGLHSQMGIKYTFFFFFALVHSGIAFKKKKGQEKKPKQPRRHTENTRAEGG